MKEERILNVLGKVDEQYINEADPEIKAKRKAPVWIKWAAMAACLCLVVGIAVLVGKLSDKSSIPPNPEEAPPVIDEGTAHANDYTEVLIYNEVSYTVCGSGEASILEACGLPTQITPDLAGNHICYLGVSTVGNAYQYYPVPKSDENIEENSIELFEYAPEPNENVYIICKDEVYFAAIRRDALGYHGIAGIANPSYKVIDYTVPEQYKECDLFVASTDDLSEYDDYMAEHYGEHFRGKGIRIFNFSDNSQSEGFNVWYFSCADDEILNIYFITKSGGKYVVGHTAAGECGSAIQSLAEKTSSESPMYLAHSGDSLYAVIGDIAYYLPVNVFPPETDYMPLIDADTLNVTAIKPLD